MERHKAKILVVEDERSMREILKVLLEEEGYNVSTASDGIEGLDLIERDIFDIIITDMRMPGVDGFGVLNKTMEVSPGTIVLVITAFGTTESAVEAMKLGAYDYIHKPFKIDEIRHIIRNALEKRRLSTEVSYLRERVKTTYELDNIIGRSRAMMRTLDLLPKIAQSTSNVLITGESGTGKEVIANAIHNLSPRKNSNIVAVNCASFPEGLLESELFGHMKGAFTGATQNKQGLFEVADKGTLFLDEITEMPILLQSKMLRAIENGSFRRVGGTSDIFVDARIIAATNRDPLEAVSEGMLREDLYYRLNSIPLNLPPLRDRKEDIPLFIEHFVSKYSSKPLQVSSKAMQMLMECPWRGNVRDLENVVERMVLFTDGDTINEDDIPPEILNAGTMNAVGLPGIDDGVDLEAIIEDIERKYLTEALSKTGGKKTEAAKLLKLTFRSFRHRLAKYGIK